MDGRPCLVVGGGPVAARKAAGLAACGARVTVVAPRFHRTVTELAASPEAAAPGAVTLAHRHYRPGEAAGYRLVITATGRSQVDGTVAADAERAGVWVNSADDAPRCSFLLPAVHRDGPVSIAVSTGGTSPALATWLRTRVARLLDAEPGRLGDLALLLGAARQRLHRQGRSTEDVDWQSLLDGPVPAMVRSGDLEGARRLVDGATAAATAPAAIPATATTPTPATAAAPTPATASAG